MSQQPSEDRQALVTKVRGSLEKTETATRELRKSEKRLVVVSISSSAACTLVAGVTAAQGPVFMTGIPGWRLACVVSAILAFVATVSTGISQHMRIGDQLATVNQCAGRLRSLDVVASMGNRDWKEVTDEYADIARSFPDYVD
jgi:ABC-type uncharacterized transport system substrate-binding protein